jgi:hypothetical protein
MAATKDDHDSWTHPTPDDLAGVTITIDGVEQTTIRGRRSSKWLVPKVVDTAVAYNRLPRDGESASGQVEFEPRGRERLVDLAAHFSMLLKLHAELQDWNRFFENLALLAICIADSVFVRLGPETAAEVVLSVSDDVGLRLKNEIGREFLAAAMVDFIKTEDTPRLALLLRDSFEPPMIVSTAATE